MVKSELSNQKLNHFQNNFQRYNPAEIYLTYFSNSSNILLRNFIEIEKKTVCYIFEF